jgi:hypothetical protein
MVSKTCIQYNSHCSCGKLPSWIHVQGISFKALIKPTYLWGHVQTPLPLWQLSCLDEHCFHHDPQHSDFYHTELVDFISGEQIHMYQEAHMCMEMSLIGYVWTILFCSSNYSTFTWKACLCMYIIGRRALLNETTVEYLKKEKTVSV